MKEWRDDDKVSSYSSNQAFDNLQVLTNREFLKLITIKESSPANLDNQLRITQTWGLERDSGFQVIFRF